MSLRRSGGSAINLAQLGLRRSYNGGYKKGYADGLKAGQDKTKAEYDGCLTIDELQRLSAQQKQSRQDNARRIEENREDAD